MNPAIDTARLAFRALTLDDFDAVHAYASDPEVTRYTAFGPNTVEQTKEFLERHVGESLQADRSNYNFGLVHKQANKLIGSCGLMRSDTNGPQYGFGYVLHKDWWGQGLACEAATALIKFGFGELRAHRLWAHVFVGNTASERVLKKLGFRYEGCALKAFYVRETWHDLQTFAMLSSEWEKRDA
ncbi:MAG TPA: GNAT family N-acetyltransferase [Steroidobacteraceae bacterium]|nr:GNAT family N-acetyltransferase [Steroidobacteraceae bacterium]